MPADDLIALLRNPARGASATTRYAAVEAIERLRAAVEALAAIVQRDRVALRKMHRNPYVGTLLDDDVKAALAEYDAALALADAAMGNETERG